MSMEEIRRIRQSTESGKQVDGVVISQSELDRIRKSTRITTKQQEIQTKKLYNEQKEQQMAAAKARKAKMQALDKERAAKLPKNEGEVHQAKVTKGILAEAENQLDEELDDVKNMNQMMVYSKCVTIRDKQLDEQKGLEDEYREEERRLDIMMEIERLKQLKYQEERDTKRKDAQRQGSLVIIDQIKEREMQRIQEREIMEREKELILKQIEDLKTEEIKAQEEKVKQTSVLMAEVEEANKKAIDIKKSKEMEEKQLEQEIVDYNTKKAQREEEIIQEQKRQQEEKEQEIQRLRELQEKASDRQAEIDALRAKRAFEESERHARAKEREEHEKKLRVLKDMEVAREAQAAEKERLLGLQARQERDEFMRIIQQQKEEKLKEVEIDDDKKKILHDHSKQLRSQIQQNEEVRKQDRLDYLEEGRLVRQKQDADKRKLEQIRGKKLNELKDIGIADKYQAELATKKIE